MSTSGTTSFNLTASGIVTEAFDLCGIGSEGEAINADMNERAMRSLNLIVKAWGSSQHLWVQTAKSVALVASQASYPLSPKPLRVVEVRRRVTSSQIDTPLSEWARQTYTEQPGKTTASIPVAFYYDPQLTAGALYIWPTASAATAASMTLELTYLRRIEDFDASADDADLPQEWLMALSYALADQLAVKYVSDGGRRQELAARAAALKAEIQQFDTEPASLYMQPNWHG